MKFSDIKKMAQNLPNGYPSEAGQDPNRLIQQLGLDPSDLYQELEMESKFVDTHQDTTYSNSHVHLHSHNFYEFLYCRHAVGMEYLVGTERYKLQKGDLILVSPGISHRPILPDHMTEPYIRDVLWISEEFIQNISREFDTDPPEDFSKVTLLRTSGTRWEYMGDLFRYGVQEAERRETGWDLAVMANTMSIIVHLQRAFADKTATPLVAEKPELLDQLLAYVEEHLAEKITLADVAHHFFISESTITQTFRKKMGVSFYRCVTQRRLISAKGLIERGMPLEAVSEQVGFSDYSSFFRAFKQEYGISPRQYRKNHTVSSESV